MTTVLGQPVIEDYYWDTSVHDEVEAVVDTDPHALARMMLEIIHEDRDRFDLIDRYVEGKHDLPYMPPGADQEYLMLAHRSITNLIPLLIGTPAQALYVDSVRRGGQSTEDGTETVPPAWQHWQNSRLDGRQLAIHRGALKYGHSFTLTELAMKYGRSVVTTKGLSAYNTAAVYEDPANDIDPYAALTIVRSPKPNAKTSSAKRGLARMWDGEYEYAVTFTSITDLDSIRVREVGPHGLEECPVTRFAASVDLEGNTCGVVEPHIAIQNRINQTVFDLLVAQTYGSFVVRTISGMAPPILRWTQAQISGSAPLPPGYTTVPEGVDPGDPVLDPHTNKPVPEPINMNARRFLFIEDPNGKASSIPATPLEGYIKSLDMSIRQLSVITQTPPHYLLGEIANLSAEALQAAETSLLRKVEEFRKSFGESWERVFRLAAALAGDTASANDFASEVVWRDTEMKSLSQVADGLVKLKELGIPAEGLFHRVPQATRTEIQKWLELRKKQIAELRARQDAIIAAGGQVQDQIREEELV